MNVIWHDLECGGYTEDLPLWHSLADQLGDPILDLGAGTGRVALSLAQAGHRVTALDRDRELLAELERRAAGLELDVVHADARAFELRRRFALCLVPMQTIQLLGGREGRLRCLRCVRGHLDTGGLAAIAITDTLDLYDVVDGIPAPLPDMCERDGIVYASHPTAVRAQADGFVLERRREVVSAQGKRTVSDDVIHLDLLTADQLEREALDAGLQPAGRTEVAATEDHVGSEVVMLRG